MTDDTPPDDNARSLPGFYQELEEASSADPAPAQPNSIASVPAIPPRATDPGQTLLDSTIRDLTGGRSLSPSQKAVVSAVQKNGLSPNDPAWLLVLPGLLTQAPVEMVREAIAQARSGGDGAEIHLTDKQVTRLADGVAARLTIRPPEIDEAILADQVSKRLAPIIQQAAPAAPSGAPAGDCKSVLTEALVNRNVIIAALVGMVMTLMGWFGGSAYRGSVDAQLIEGLKGQIQVLQQAPAERRR